MKINNEKLKIKTYETIEKLKELDVEKLVLTTLGNSISTGFSFNDDNIPLLERNKYLQEAASNNEIEIELHKFSRSENNSDEKIFNYIINNLSEKEIDELNIRDYNNHFRHNDNVTMTNPITILYPRTSNEKIQNTLFNNKEKTTANIVIYNGGTGAFLDNITRKGKHYFNNGINKDISYIEATLGLIQNSNRNKESNTQVYLCGAPRIVNTSLTNVMINSKLKIVVNRYSNVTYVDNFKRKPFYNINGKLTPDPHYNNEEYLYLNYLILDKIKDNYEIKKILIELDRELQKLNTEKEMGTYSKKTRCIVEDIIDYHSIKIKTIENRKKFLSECKKYLLERYPYDFAFLDYYSIKNCKKYIKR